ncbi:SusF/SusE family outer membrane protein [Mucilaginibacter achroorhodeus]|uniref:SusF/SusE family outer membrane protein n=1 Tax=Mucilaginibacter achroorhodeus TaxID=2599294 RepID=A0A563TYV0_9SPHI|nr:SusE domain-containing protein [Mucilaginibacter achroorhodeus]TWR24310.1 SusF/SusE family outer membrane protein [Mucilaginibacter achroorhodeus]
MKKNITKFLAFSCMAIMLLASCKKDEVRTVAQTAKGGSLTVSTTTPALTKSNLSANAITLTGSAQSYGYSAAPTYTFQIAVKGTDFAKPTEVTLPVGVFAKSYNVQDFNNLLLSMNLPTGTPAQLEMRLKSSLSSSATEGTAYSNVVTVTATPFALVSYIYVPGAYQGWNPPTADSLQSPTGNGVYTGIINFTAGNLDFKITPQKKWDVAYGSSGAGKISTSGGNISAPAAGKYYFTVDLNNGTITMAPADYMSVIGNAPVGSNWSADIDLKYNNGTLAWEGAVPMVAGEFKFRMGHDWANSYGVPKTGGDGTFLNNTENNNIPITTAGTYNVSITTIYSDYTTDISKLGKIDRSATAKYSVVKQ